MSILIKNATIVTMNHNRQIIEDGAIAIQNTEIVDVGKTTDLAGKYKFEKVIDVKKNIIPQQM